MFQTHLVFADNTLKNATYSSDEEIKKWAIEAVKQVMTYNYQNYKERTEQNSLYFTKKGWVSFSQAIEKSHIIDKVIKDKLSLKSFQSDLVEICNIEKKQDARILAIVVPIKTLYSSERNKKSTSQVTLIFVEETKAQNGQKNQRGINQWISGAFKGEENCQWYEDVTSAENNIKEYESWKGIFDGILEIGLKEAENGDAEAQMAVGLMFLQGVGAEQDYKAAFEWFNKSAAQNNIDAYYFLGEIYYEGLGVKQDYKEALKWYKKSAMRGQYDAQMMLSIYYYTGKGGIPIDDIEAYAWADIASKSPENTDKAEDLKFRDNPAENLSPEALNVAKAKALKYYKLYVEPFN